MFEMHVSSVFHFRGQGMVFHGLIQSGEVYVGDDVEVRSSSQSVRARVAGLEGDGGLVKVAKAGDKVGVLLRSLTPENVSECLERMEAHGWKVLSLSLLGVTRPWWKIW